MFGRYKVALCAQLLVGVSAVLVTFSRDLWELVLPHFGLGLGIGIIDSALMPLLACLVDERHNGAYGAVYAIAQESSRKTRKMIQHSI
jgi:DHA1 family solute carrier family 18 vesicular amine transporter 1/2